MYPHNRQDQISPLILKYPGKCYRPTRHRSNSKSQSQRVAKKTILVQPTASYMAVVNKTAQTAINLYHSLRQQILNIINQA